MKFIKTLALIVALSSPFASAAEGVGRTDDLIAMGTYVATDDIDTSEDFYMALFGRAPVIRLDDFIAFDISGGWFAIVSRDRYAKGAIPGSGAVPYIQSSDLEAVQARTASATGGTAPEIITEPGIQLLKVYDPDGQLIEFFSLSAD